MNSKILSLRELQLLEFEIAKEVKRICEENNITYFLVCGSLLGAVRHEGFIPWDDDMDIGMFYDDYLRFLKIAKTEMGSKFLLQNWNDGTAYAYPFSKVKMLGTSVIEKANKDLDIDKGVWVDIFPYISLNKSQAHSSTFKRKLQILGKMCLLKNGYDLNSLTTNKLSKLLNVILKYTPITYKKARSIFEKLLSNNTECDYYIQCDGMFNGRFVFPKEYLSDFSKLKFENTEFSVPSQYHQYLKESYGDYMKLPSEKERNSGHSIIEAKILDLK